MSGKAVLVIAAAGIAFGLSYAVGEATESDEAKSPAAGTQTVPSAPPPPVKLRTASKLPPLRGAPRRRRRRAAAPAPAAPSPAPVRRVRRVQRRIQRPAVPRRTVTPTPSPAPAPRPAPRPSPSPPPTSFDDSG